MNITDVSRIVFVLIFVNSDTLPVIHLRTCVLLHTERFPIGYGLPDRLGLYSRLRIRIGLHSRPKSAYEECRAESLEQYRYVKIITQ